MAVVVLVVLGAFGLGVEGRLKPTTLDVPGTESSRAEAILKEHFGDSAPFAILLEGPPAQIESQGPALVAKLRRQYPRLTTLSPWDRGSLEHLRPGPRKALILADFHVSLDQAVDHVVPHLEETLENEVRPPLQASQAGFATLSRALQQQSIAAAERGELIALPILLIVLLLVFRSPVAAGIPLGFGAVTVFASRGVLHFATSWFSVDAFALTVCTMMGLALGVDYALLMVSRFREELAGGAEPFDAAWTTQRHAGRTVAFAGSTLLISMIVALFIVPGSLLASLAGTLSMVVVLSVAVATLVGPAVLVLLGRNVDRWRIGKPVGEGRSRLMAVVGAALKRPAAVAALIGGIVLVLAAPAVGLKTGPPSPEQLPSSDQARQEAEKIDAAIGPGWDAPFQVVATTGGGPITGATDLSALTHFQRKLADLPGVQAVVGPAQVEKRTARLRELGNATLSSDGNIGPVKELGKLGRNLDVAAGGVGQLRGGLSEASAGAGLLVAGSDRAGQGAELIAGGLGRAVGGSERALNALQRFDKGAHRLAKAQATAAVGGLQLKLATRDLGGPNFRINLINRARKLQKELTQVTKVRVPPLLGPARGAEEQLKAALAALGAMTTGKADPQYAAALAAVQAAAANVSGVNPATGTPVSPSYKGLPAELEAAEDELESALGSAKYLTSALRSEFFEIAKVINGAEKLSEGLYKISHAGHELANGASRLSKAAGKLSGGLDQLSSGATALVGGLDRLTGGTESLQASRAEGFHRSAPLESGLQKASVQVISGRKKLVDQVGKVKRGSPNLFNSGYFVLSQVDGAPPKAREAAAATIDVPNGGQAASMLVVSRYSFNTPGSIKLNKHLNKLAADFGEEAELTTGVAGGAAQLNDYSHVTRARIPYVVAAITLVTFLVLLLILRALPLAAIAVGLNLATVAVAFGILTALSYLPDSVPLGGHKYVDAVGATMIFGIVFGLSIDYAVFLLVRMREHYDREGDNEAAIRFGLEKTARVITGAAAIMVVVFVVFAAAPIATVSQLGVGLMIAVLLDATVVRIILLPSLMLLIGDRVWWFPRFLERALPRLNV